MRLATNKHASFITLLGVVLFSGAVACPAQAGGVQRQVEDVTAAPDADAQAPGYYALVIGNSKYANLHPLETPASDANAVASLLRGQFGFKTVVLLDATRAKILGALASYRSLPKNSNLLVYYAGHGYLDVGEAFWLPIDASKDNRYDWISADDIRIGVSAIKSKHVLVISDSCYSGAILADDSRSARLDEGDLEKMQELPSRDWMASGSIEPVADGGAHGHSIFAGALLQGLTSMKDSQFSASDLFYGFVRRKVGGNSQQLPQYGLIRNSGDQLGDFVFSRSAKLSGSVATAPTPPVVQVPPSARPSKTPGVGNGVEMTDRGWNYQHGLGGLPKDDVQALSWYRKAAASGDARGMSYLGGMYANGLGGLPKDEVQAVAWFQKAADAGNGIGMSSLAKMYLHGLGGLPKDDVEAEKWYSKAAEAGDAKGMADLGVMYEHGRGGLPKDELQALSWYRKAVDAGDGLGMVNLGLMYQHGRGLPKDEAQAVNWYRKAADAGNEHGMENLGRMFEEGRGGLPKDEAQAVSWYRKAVEGGDATAAEALKRLGK